MKLNEKLKIIGQGVILIPYEEKHVEKYHKWMSDKELQELTASEPLTIEQEYEMQRSWRIDDDKCTFLILDKEKYETTGDEIESLIGDTNLFLDHESHSAETEIMIAEPDARRKRFGWQAMLMMIKFGVNHLSCGSFFAKIGCSNDKSQRMFEKMQFMEVSRSDIFQEITYERFVDLHLHATLTTEVFPLSVVLIVPGPIHTRTNSVAVEREEAEAYSRENLVRINVGKVPGKSKFFFCSGKIAIKIEIPSEISNAI